MSDDNPYVESLFGTMKTRAGYPKKPFETLEKAQAWVDRFVRWYNEEHRHSALNCVSPMARHNSYDAAKRPTVELDGVTPTSGLETSGTARQHPLLP